ncbi:carboxypeptidase regulatory-like domain-containing protein [Paludisphaera mucosa]|uniref:Carboxypeptidase regulatory-like domain-containing protein n=1 Tax=Paludisphaera mucosa TaxID=3030827 RepID=A0ABT6FER7_9BACT|nr:carboxypeptidase regulatory-like domain-containing protein [Paludisphaera mucosa]MDG3006067.1 carboxypeptidase regulatory-like domain-containing protein [Paludisphaera mucosa]
MIDDVGSMIAASRIASFALDAALKATVLMTLAFAVHFALGRRRTLSRSALWNACLVGMSLLPLVGMAFPRWRAVVLPGRVASRPPARIVADVDVSPALPEPTPPALESPLDHRPVDPSRPVTAPRPTAVAPAVGGWRRVGAAGMVVTAYLAVVAALLLRLAASLIGVGRLRRACEPVDAPRWIEARDRWRGRLGVDRPVALRATDRVSVPLVVGWLRPAVVLPRGLVATATDRVIDAVVLHELAHVRRGDFGWNLARKVVQAFYWPHPLAWLMGRTIGAVREQACDDLCVHALGGASEYRESLLAVASGLIRRPDPTIGLAMARTSNLGRRLAWIDRTRGASRCLSRRPVRVAFLLTAAVAAAALGSFEPARVTARAAQEPAKPAPAKHDADAKAPDSVEVVVLAKDTGKPLAGAIVRPLIDMVTSDLETDREGRLRIDLSRRKFRRDAFSIDVWADGYVQQRYFFSQDDPRDPKIPDRIGVELLPGEESLGGVVNDEQGRPIAGVKVAIWGYLGEKKQPAELCYMVEALTDAQGRWRCRCFRKMTFAYLYLTHPDFVSDGPLDARRHGRPDVGGQPAFDTQPMASLRDFFDVQVMTRGVEVAGEVRDPQGRPIRGAEVGWLVGGRENTVFHGDLPTTSADAQGRFRFPHVQPGRVGLQVKAAGHAPEFQFVEAKDGAAPVAISLRPASSLSGRVVDSKGNPIADAFVVVDQWRSTRALGVFLNTDADGRFRWDDAPNEPILMNVSRAGFLGITFRRVSNADGEAVFTLERSLSIAGKVRDAVTRKRIDEIQVEVGTTPVGEGEATWREKPEVFAYQGELQADVKVEETPEFRLRIQSKGYATHVSRVFRGDEKFATYDVVLAPLKAEDGNALAGVVRRPDGAPLAGADVAIAYPRTTGNVPSPSVRIRDGSIQADATSLATKTDERGRFNLVRESDSPGRRFEVVVAHPEFYAEVDGAAFEADPTVKTQPWGRLEGVARIGGKLAVGVTIRYAAARLGVSENPSISNVEEVKADQEGRYAFARVIPGEASVAVGSRGGSDRTGSSGDLVDVKAGETTRFDPGSVGRPVVARIATPAGFAPNADYAANSWVDLVSDRPAIPSRPKVQPAGRDANFTWLRNWWASSEGREYRRGRHEWRLVKIRPDGTVRIEDVPPGDYRLKLAYQSERVQGPLADPAKVAVATRQFVIPSIPGGRSDEPFDLGVLHPKPRQALKVGERVPAFDVETLDGGRVKLEDLRGKFVLVAFWASWCGPCLAEIPYLKDLHDRFADDGRFAILGLSLDADKEAARRLIAEKGVPWAQGYLGEWSEGGVQDAYHVQALPALFLIGPDGALRGQNLQGEDIEAEVARALGSP